MKKALLALAAVVVLQGSALAADFLDDVKQFRAANKDASADISGIAQKYIAAGQTKEMVEGYLTARKFTLNYQPLASGQSQTLVAVYAEKGLIGSMGFQDEVRVVVVLEKGLVKSVTSQLIYRAL